MHCNRVGQNFRSLTLTDLAKIHVLNRCISLVRRVTGMQRCCCLISKFVDILQLIPSLRCACTLADDDDIMRRVRNLFIRTNILIRTFSKSSLAVK